MYDITAQKLAVKAIGTVESGLTYDAINFDDPITVGVMQWYGTRAAALLQRIKTDNPSSWVGVALTVEADLLSKPVTSTWWNTRALSYIEGESLKPVLLANQTLQNTQAFEDLEDYKQSAENLGFDVDGNTQATLFFFVMYHQSPRQAINVVASAGPQSSISRLYEVCLNNTVLGRYRTRYTTARDIIISGDISGVDDPHDPSPNPETGGDNGSEVKKLASDIRYLEIVGDKILIHHKDGKLFTLFDGRGRFVPSFDASKGSTVSPLPDNPSPSTPPSADAATKQQDLVDFVSGYIGQFSYSRTGSRLNPLANMYTDCSGLMYWVYQQVLGLNIGTYTGNQYNQGTLVQQGSGDINLSLLQKGDLIFFNWNGGRDTVDHVEMFTGGTQMIGHGGPESGPQIHSVQSWANNALNWYVRRHVS